jgi:pentose-5-phosphate-3-epimerase
MVEKVRRNKDVTDVPVEVDGGITEKTDPLMVEAGAQALVATPPSTKATLQPRCAASSRPDAAPRM